MTLEAFRRRYQYNPETDLIGTGGFSKVYKAFDTEMERDVALKFYYGDLDEKYGVIAELQKVIHIQHPNLIRYYVAMSLDNPNIYDSRSKIQVGVVEFANGGDFNDFMKTFPSLRQINTIVKDILKGLAFLHENGIIHRDIKPQNILMHKVNGTWLAKIADFGLAKRVENQTMVSSKLLGTMEYMAPEQFNPSKYGIDGKLGTNVDLWSLGVILFEMFTGDLPFGGRNDGTTQQQLMFRIMQEKVDLGKHEIIEPYRRIILQCLTKKAGKRALTANALIDILEGRTIVEQANTTPISPRTVRIAPSDRKKMLIGSILLTPLFGVFHYLKWRKQYPTKASEAADIAWTGLITWLGILVVIVGTMILFDINL